MNLRDWEEHIDREYQSEKRNASDINEHLHTLRELAMDCTHVTEMG